MSKHIRVNPIACEAHGMCAELLPELIALDEWGYPIVDGKPVPAELVAAAELAAEACPTFALLIDSRRTPSQRREDRRMPAGSVRRRAPRLPDEPRR
ncbi:MAG TPA: ferredoxin [Solirubrobacteraceae bacterium]